MVKKLIESLAYSPEEWPKENDQYANDYNLEERFINSPSGKVHIYELAPKLKQKPTKTIIHFHGSGYNINKHIGHVSWLPAHGYRVIMFDYPGYGKSDGSPTRHSVVDASKAVIEEQEGTFLIFGQSLGGAIAIESLSKIESQKYCTGLVVDSTFNSYSEIAKIKLSKKFKHLAFVKRFIPKLLSRDHDPINNLLNIKCPVLALHSRDDQIVPFHLFQSLIKSSSIEIDTWVTNNTGHTGIFRNNFKDYRIKLVAWIEESFQRRII